MKMRTKYPALLLLLLAAAASGCRDDSSHTTVQVPAGTQVVASLETLLNTQSNRSGDAFVARLEQPIVVDGTTVIAEGAQVHGELRDVQASGNVKGRAQMTLVFEEIVDARGQTHPISATPLVLQAASETGDDVEKIAAGGIAGAIIGGLAGGAKGAVIGTAVGAGAGTIVMLATKGDDIELAPGQKLNVHIDTATSITFAAKQ